MSQNLLPPWVHKFFPTQDAPGDAGRDLTSMTDRAMERIAKEAGAVCRECTQIAQLAEELSKMTPEELWRAEFLLLEMARRLRVVARSQSEVAIEYLEDTPAYGLDLTTGEMARSVPIHHRTPPGGTKPSDR